MKITSILKPTRIWPFCLLLTCCTVQIYYYTSMHYYNIPLRKGSHLSQTVPENSEWTISLNLVLGISVKDIPRVVNHTIISHSQLTVVRRITTKPLHASLNATLNITDEQRQILKKLTDTDFAYANVSKQKFSLKEVESFSKQPIKDKIPIYADWATIRKHVNRTWYQIYEQAQGRYDNHFRPWISFKERQQMTATIEVFMKACEWANVTYFLAGGSLLGAFRHHGIIPWDDDIDVLVKSSHWKKLYYVLSRIPEFTIYARGTDMWKFYLTDLPRTFNNHNYPYRWPFLDVFFYAENATHLWGTTRSERYVASRKSQVFPLLRRPFEHTLAPVPCNARTQLFHHFNDGGCMTSVWNHKKESGRKPHLVKCTILHRTFPFVFPMNNDNGTVTEILKVGNRTIQTFIAPPECTGV